MVWLNWLSPQQSVWPLVVAPHAPKRQVDGRIERLPSAAGPVKRDATILPTNPLGQVPTFLTDDGQALFDSRVICEYLNDQQRGTLFPASGKARWARLTELSLADGMTAAVIDAMDRLAR